MKKRLNQKGFTLVELLAVLVILITIMGIAIPTISSSLERTKAKQNQARYKVLETTAEMYVTDNKNNIYNNLGIANSCYIKISELENYIPDDATKDADNNELSGVVLYTKPNKYEYKESIPSGVSLCSSQENVYNISELKTNANMESTIEILATTSFEYVPATKTFNLTGSTQTQTLTLWGRMYGSVPEGGYMYTCSIDGSSTATTCSTLYQISNYGMTSLEYYTYTIK